MALSTRMATRGKHCSGAGIRYSPEIVPIGWKETRSVISAGPPGAGKEQSAWEEEALPPCRALALCRSSSNRGWDLERDLCRIFSHTGAAHPTWPGQDLLSESSASKRSLCDLGRAELMAGLQRVS